MTWCPRPFVLPCSSIRPIFNRRGDGAGSAGAAPTIGLQIQILNASTNGEIDAAFATLARERPDALFVAPDDSSSAARGQFAALTARDRIPASYPNRDMSQPAG